MESFQLQSKSFHLQVESQEVLHLANDNASEARRIGNEIMQNCLPAISQQNQQIVDGFDQFRNMMQFIQASQAAQEQSIKKFLERFIHTGFGNMLNDLFRDQDRYYEEGKSWLLL